MDKLTLVAATATDLDILLPLVEDYHRTENMQIGTQASATAVEKLLDQPALGKIWLIKHDDVIIGYIVLCTGFSIEFCGLDAFIDEFFILPEYRGRGFGRQTLECIKVEAKSMDIRAIHLEVGRENTRARALYSQAGFIPREKYILMSTFTNSN